jgi:H+-translocating diphosphatase
MQIIMSIVVFVLLGAEHNFSTKWTTDDDGKLVTPSLYNGLFTMIAFNLGAFTSIASGFLGMKIATYANARVAVEARKGIAPAFEAGAARISALEMLLLMRTLKLPSDKMHAQY